MGGRESTILENSITQTAGSAGESLAFGLGVTMPAIMILGFDLEISRVMLVGVLGGLLGILMMIPMRRTMIVDQHRELKYPEGTACAEVLKAAATGTSREAAGEVRLEPVRTPRATPSARGHHLRRLRPGLAVQGRQRLASRAGRTRSTSSSARP
jgi:uncharacterized oligopeptide transporter (OPT) family protein